jgi:hypothetical protein
MMKRLHKCERVWRLSTDSQRTRLADLESLRSGPPVLLPPQQTKLWTRCTRVASWPDGSLA